MVHIIGPQILVHEKGKVSMYKNNDIWNECTFFPNEDAPTEEERAFFLAAGDLLSIDERKSIEHSLSATEEQGQYIRFSKDAKETAEPLETYAVDSLLLENEEPEPGFFAASDIEQDSNLAIPMALPLAYREGNKSEERNADFSVDVKEKRVQFGKKKLLHHISFTASYGDFILILGGSGAGKTTLVKAILGESRADGQILLDGQNLYDNFKSLKAQIGIVPQFLTLRLNDTVKNTVTDAARIKLEKLFTKHEIAQRVENVLIKVGIKELENSLIGNLSGGQKKKVAVAVQLVGFQKVFICDEPDSGLDAASRMQLMELLKEISESGKIVMLITHYPDDAIHLFTKVVVIAKSREDNAGHLAYSGDVAGALRFFGVNRLQDIMLEINPVHEGGKGNADQYISKYTLTVRG